MIEQFNKKNYDAAYKKQYNQTLFIAVAPLYDRVTETLSLKRDKAWKRILVQLLPNKKYKNCLDIACGTGDITFLLAQKYPDAEITGIDLSVPMLAQAEIKNNQERIHFLAQDMCHLIFDNESYDLVTGGYALRNAPSLEIALDECFRVLKPGGVAAFLDFSKPNNRVLQKINYFLLKMWCSLWGVVYHRNASVYGYIAESLIQFPTRKILHEKLHKQGFKIITTKQFFLGIMELIICQKEN